MKQVAGEDRQQSHEWNNKDRRADDDQQAGAHRLVAPAELPAFNNAPAERLIDTIIAAGAVQRFLTGAQLPSPYSREKIAKRLSAVSAAGADQRNQKTRDRRPGAARNVEDDRI